MLSLQTLRTPTSPSNDRNFPPDMSPCSKRWRDISPPLHLIRCSAGRHWPQQRRAFSRRKRLEHRQQHHVKSSLGGSNSLVLSPNRTRRAEHEPKAFQKRRPTGAIKLFFLFLPASTHLAVRVCRMLHINSHKPLRSERSTQSSV